MVLHPKARLQHCLFMLFCAVALLLTQGCHKDKGHRFPVDGSGSGNGGSTGTEVQPKITLVNPSFGPLAGGNLVTITGLNFMDSTSVQFGDVKSSNVTVISDLELEALVPAGTATGFVSVTVTTEEGEHTLADAYAYRVPEVLAVEPGEGPIAGGIELSIIGRWFLDNQEETHVWLGSGELTDVEVVSDSLIRGTTQAHVAGVVNVSVENSLGVGLLIDAYRYIGPPEITSVTPDRGSIEGGFEVVLSGSEFTSSPTNVMTIQFGAVPITAFDINEEETEIRLLAPSVAEAQTVTIQVTNKYGTSAIPFVYYSGEVAIHAITPASGPLAGGTAVTITGEHFTSTADTTVDFGQEPLGNVTVVSDTTITGITPAGAAPGDVAVTLTCSNGTAGGTFTYLAPPALTAVTPDKGSHEGGTDVVITGTGFSDDLTVLTLCGQALQNIVVVDETTINAQTPPGDIGQVCDLRYESPAGIAVLPEAFTYEEPFAWPVPELTSIAPNHGSPEGGTQVTIRGAGFNAPIQSLTLCGNDLVNVNVVDENTIEAATPPGAEGNICDLFITTEGGQARLDEAFAYQVPAEFNVSILFPLCGITQSEGMFVEGALVGTDQVEAVQVTSNGDHFSVNTTNAYQTFNSQVQLALGDNTIAVHVVDKYGVTHQDAATVTIRRLTSEPVDGPLGIAISPNGRVAYSDFIRRGILAIGDATGETIQVNGPVPAWDIDANGSDFDGVYIPNLMAIPGDGSPATVAQQLKYAVFYAMVRENADAVLATSLSTQRIWRLKPGSNSAGVVTDGDFEHGALLEAPRGIARLASGTILVSDWAQHTIIAVDPETGDRTLVSGAGQGDGPALIRPEAIALLDENTLAVASAEEAGLVFSVDLATGNRTILSDAQTGNGKLPIRIFDMAVDNQGDLVLSDPDTPAIMALNPGTGDRMPLLNGATGAGPKIKRPEALAAGAGMIYAANKLNGALYAIDPATGDRALVSGNGAGAGPAISHVNGMALVDETAYVISGLDSRIMAVDIQTGVRRIASGDTVGSGPSIDQPAAIAAGTGGRLILADNGAQSIVSIDTADNGNRTLLSGPALGNGPDLADMSGIARVGDHIMVTTLQGDVLRINPENGEREALTLSGAAPTLLYGIQPMTDDVVLLLAPDGIFYLVLETMTVSSLSSMDNGSGPLPVRAKSITMDDNSGLYISDVARRAVFQVQIQTGDRVLMSR